MEGHGGADISVPGHKIDYGAGLRLAGGVGTGTGLLMFGTPLVRKVAVQVQPFFVRLKSEGRAIEIGQAALRQEAEVFAPDFRGIPANQETVVVRVLLPGAVGIRDTHLQHQTVAIHILAF